VESALHGGVVTSHCVMVVEAEDGAAAENAPDDIARAFLSDSAC
jgi:hypothetical protein